MSTPAKRESIRLSEARVKALRPEETTKRVWDSAIPGFHVRITPKGSKTYAVAFQRPSGAKVHVTIGSTEVFTVDEAREQARQLRALHDAGRDARAFIHSQRNAQDMAALVELWERNYRQDLKPSSRLSYGSIIKAIILPALGTRLVKDLDFPTVKALHRKESQENPIGANRMVTVLSRLMNIAELEGWRPRATNPCYRFPKTREAPRQRVLTAAELGRLEAAMASLETLGNLDQVAADLIRFLALSGLRTSEAENLRWTDIDLDRGVMVIPDHKTSKTMGPKSLPLSEPLRSILKRRAGFTLGALAFPGLRNDSPIRGLRKMWLRVLAVEGCSLGDATPHDLRRTFMSTCTELGYPPAIGDTLLGHSLGKITDTYTKLSMDGILARASEDTAQWLASAMRGEAPQTGKKIGGDSEQRAMA